MSHFLDRLTFFRKNGGHLRRRPWRGDRRTARMGGRVPQALAARQDRALHARGELHRLLLVEDLRQGRHRHLGDAADRLSAHPPRHAEPRAARLCAWRQLLLVPVLGQPGEASAGARPAAEAVAGSACGAHARRRLGVDRGGRGQARQLRQQARPGRLGARDVGRGERDHRRGQRLHGEDLRPGPRDRFLADPGDVDGLLRRRLTLPLAARGRVHELLRLVLRPAAGQPDDLGRADRRAGKRRLVQRRLPDAVGIERPADPHAGRAFLHRGPLQGDQERRRFARLCRGDQVRRPVVASETGHRRRAGAGDRPRDPAGVLPRPHGAVFPGLREALHRSADAGAPGAAGRSLRAGAAAACGGFRRCAGRGEQRRLEDGGAECRGKAGGTAGFRRLPLGRTGQSGTWKPRKAAAPTCRWR